MFELPRGLLSSSIGLFFYDNVQRSCDCFVYFGAVPGMWAKKYAVGKEDLAKLVDDTYRCLFFCCIFTFSDHYFG